MAEEPKSEEPDFNKFEEDLDMSYLDEEAFHMYELHRSLIKAGFRERQALTLVAMIVNDANEAEIFYTRIDDEEQEDSGDDGTE